MEEAMINIRANNKNVILDNISHLASLDCMRDAKIVCKDGALRWSSLLLSQWSKVVRERISATDGFTPDQPLMVLVPHARVAVVEKALEWSTKGIVSVTGQEVGHVASLLISLGIEDDSFHELVAENGQTANKSQSEVGKWIVRDDQGEKPNSKKYQEVTQEIGEDSGYDSFDNNAADASEIPMKRAKKKINRTLLECPLCPVKANRPHKLINHVCSVHYRKKLLSFWGQKDTDAPCRFCNQLLFKKGFKGDGNRKVIKISVHLGSLHGKIMNVASESVRKWLVRNKSSLAFDEKDQDWRKCKVLISKLYGSCSQCCKLISDPNTMITHLAQVHMADKLLNHFEVLDTRKCKMCSNAIEPSFEGTNFNCVRHLIDNHIELFYNELPKDLARALKISTTNQWQLMNNRCKERKAFFANANHGEASKDLGSQHFPCPRCTSSFERRNQLKIHVAMSHFRQELLGIVEVKNMRKCPMCGEGRGSNKSPRCKLEELMAAHIGNIHNGLVKVLPEDIKEHFASLKIPIESKEPLTELEKSLGRSW